MQLFLNGGGPERLAKTITYYKTCLRAVFDRSPVVTQTSILSSGQELTTLTPTYLCLQCSVITTEIDLPDHAELKKHRFCTDNTRMGR